MSTSAKANANGWLETIRDIAARLANADEMEDAQTEAYESALSVQLRSDWYTPGTKPSQAEYMILLTTGGPGLRIYGECDDHGEPHGRPRLQWQDWGTDWTDAETDSSDDEALSAFVSCFIFS